MTDLDPITPEERRLWQMTAEGGPAPGDCPTELDLAAYLDGRLPDDERARLEDHLAACSARLAAIRAARELLANASLERALVPAAVLERAKSLVEQSTRRVRAHRHAHRVNPWSRVGRWTAAAAALLVACLIGYRAGARCAPAEPEINLVSEMSFGAMVDDEATELDPFDDLLPDDGEEVSS